jgi:hypothetical protein
LARGNQNQDHTLQDHRQDVGGFTLAFFGPIGDGDFFYNDVSNHCIKQMYQTMISPILDDVAPLVGDKPRSLGYLGMALLCAVYFCSHGDVLRL